MLNQYTLISLVTNGQNQFKKPSKTRIDEIEDFPGLSRVFIFQIILFILSAQCTMFCAEQCRSLFLVVRYNAYWLFLNAKYLTITVNSSNVDDLFIL